MEEKEVNLDKILEFDKVKMRWKELAVTEYAHEQIDAATFMLAELELKSALKDTTDARELIEKLGTPPLQNVTEIKEVMEAASKDECLTPYQLERVGMILSAVRRLKDYLERGKAFQNSLAYYEENLDSVDELREEIARQIRYERVDDYASKELSQLRMQITKKTEDMKQKADQIMRANKDILADSFSTFRNGRLCIPVKKEYKHRLPGSVIDKSATGSTLFVEPVGVAHIYEEIDQFRISEENEVYRILYTLTAMVAGAEALMQENIRMMEKLDYIFSKGKLSLDMQACEPVITIERNIRLKNARHPLMDRSVCVPLQFEMGGETKGIVITGPNTGGKTVAIKTVMLNCLMAQSGLHVTCDEASICMNSNYLCDIGDGQNISENLSTFSAHIKNVLEVLSEVNGNSLVIMDELGSGTDPAEGMGIAIAILEELRKSECHFIVTTHYPEVKEYADKAESIVNARMTFDKDSLLPTYQMIIGEAGESCAFYIADRLGMPESMLKVAVEAAYGKKAAETFVSHNQNKLEKKKTGSIKKIKKNSKKANMTQEYNIGDSVMIYPDQKIGIVCEKINEKGVLRVQVKGKKIWINRKRVKLHVAASELYPEDYDFSIIFESVENRKLKHEMGRKYTEATIIHEEE
ncbi:MAG: DNA mismatch repair protein MutS [Lachnospiraceae bacterium]|nr:DNA mismatch repair protein MutS [Lachnospiraceae bacterium]MBR4085489.1 DNA mismatch repair protein MutS [Lachnospiraceae bacterium]